MTDTVYEVEVPLRFTGRGKQPVPPLTANERLHWRAERARKKQTRETVAWRCLEQSLPFCRHITVGLHYTPGDKRLRDPSNLMPTQKAAVDGLVQAGVVQDDNPKFVAEVMPVIHDGPGPRRLWLRIEVTP